MAAFTGTPTSSVQYAKQIALVQEKMDSYDLGVLRVARFNYTHTTAAGTGTGEVNLVKLPAGAIRVYPDLCRIVTSQFEANADLHIGHRAYTNEAGTAVTEDDNEWLDNADAGGGALDGAFLLPADGGGDGVEYNSQDGIIVFAMIDTGDIAAADTISGYVVFSGGTPN